MITAPTTVAVLQGLQHQILKQQLGSMCQQQLGLRRTAVTHTAHIQPKRWYRGGHNTFAARMQMHSLHSNAAMLDNLDLGLWR